MRDTAVLVGLLGGIGLLIYSSGAGSMTNINPPLDTSLPDNNGKTLEDKIEAFLGIIREFESGNNYYARAGMIDFIDESSHPYYDMENDKKLPAARVFINGKAIPTTASGAYQINVATYLEFADKTGIYGFSPPEQDVLARAILLATGAVNNLNIDDLPGAFRKASVRWESLPFARNNQNPRSLEVATATYESYLA